MITAADPQLPTTKAVVFRLIHGPRHGENSLYDPEGYSDQRVIGYWVCTNGGEIGRRFGCGTRVAYSYEVYERLESDGLLEVRCIYLGLLEAEGL